jgi:hypothetical protein
MIDENNDGVTKVDRGELTQASLDEQKRNQRLFELNQALMPQFGYFWNPSNLLFLKRQTLSRFLYFNMLYEKIIDVPGVICEFGVHWGATLSQLINLRGIYEPYNHSRKIYGFDTFTGFKEVNAKDGLLACEGDFAVGENYEMILDEILTLQESFSPISHMKKFALVKGDASETIDIWLKDNPEATIALAIFDMDLYKPTKDVLLKIIPRLIKGSILVFDEFSCHFFPGELLALREVFDMNKMSFKRFPHQPYQAWCVWGE